MKTQLIRIFLLFGLIPSIILAIGLTITFMYEAKEALEQSAQNQLLVQRSDKKSEVEHYLEFLKSQVRTYSDSKMVKDAAKSFKYAFDNFGAGNTSALTTEKQRLTDFYTQQFQQKYESLNEGLGLSFNVTAVMNQISRKGLMLQDTYISNNPNPLGEKDALSKAGDYSSYDRVHNEYHDSFREYLKEFGYYDIFIVDAEEGNIIYSVFKELDFATSLKTGPYADSGIGEAYRKALTSTAPEQVFVSDFKPYTPSYESPAAFLSSPIFDNDTLIGVLIFQAPIDKLNELMTYNESWKEKGLGDSGETYLVGPDYLMRSQGRFIVEDKQAYLAAIRDGGLGIETISKIDRRDSTVGLQPVQTPGVEKGLAGETGFMIFDDYRGVPVLSAYAPIEVEGFPWVLLSEIDKDEAYQPVYAALRTTLITGALMLAIIILITIYIAKRYATTFVTPLYYVMGVLKAISKDIEEGHVDLTQPLAPPGNSQVANNIANGINTMLSRFSHVLRQFSTITESISEASVEVASLSTCSSENMKQQYTETVQIATAITELSASANEVSNNANNALQAASATDKDTQAGSDTVNSAANTIHELASRLSNVSELVNKLENDSESIGTVLTVIQGIAEQTNLLALNAAIEAARAGEQGRGFAVVADEVRTLAARTQDSTKEIQTIIEQLQTSSTEAVQAMTIGCEMASDGLEKASTAGEALTSIKNQVSDLDGMTALIAEAAGEQSRVSESVNHNVNSISQLTEQTATDVEQTSEAAQRLQSLANELHDIAAQFKV